MTPYKSSSDRVNTVYTPYQILGNTTTLITPWPLVTKYSFTSLATILEHTEVLTYQSYHHCIHSDHRHSDHLPFLKHRVTGALSHLQPEQSPRVWCTTCTYMCTCECVHVYVCVCVCVYTCEHRQVVWMNGTLVAMQMQTVSLTMDRACTQRGSALAVHPVATP